LVMDPSSNVSETSSHSVLPQESIIFLGCRTHNFSNLCMRAILLRFRILTTRYTAQSAPLALLTT